MKKTLMLLGCLSLNAVALDEVALHESIVPYEIEAENIKELVEQVQVYGPEHQGKATWAMLSWDIVIEYNFKSYDGLCHINIVHAEVFAQVRLPKWSNSDLLSNEKRKWWRQFLTFISGHEKAHIENVHRETSDLVETLSTHKGFDNCDEAKENYIDSKHASLAKIKENDKQIDELALKAFYRNEVLLDALGAMGGSIVIESGASRSFIGF